MAFDSCVRPCDDGAAMNTDRAAGAASAKTTTRQHGRGIGNLPAPTSNTKPRRLSNAGGVSGRGALPPGLQVIGSRGGLARSNRDGFKAGFTSRQGWMLLEQGHPYYAYGSR